MSRTGSVETDDEGDRRSRCRSTSTGRARRTSTTPVGFLSHMLETVAKHARFDLTVGRRATCTSTPTTPSRTSASRSARRSTRPSATRAGHRALRDGVRPARRGARALASWTSPAGRTSSSSRRSTRSSSSSRATSRSRSSRSSGNRPRSAGSSTCTWTSSAARNGHHAAEAVFKSAARALRAGLRGDGDRRPLDEGNADGMNVAARHARRLRGRERRLRDARVPAARRGGRLHGRSRPRRRGARGSSCRASPRSPRRWRASSRPGLEAAVRAAVNRGGRLLGLCLGFQLLFEESEEHGRHQGLGLVRGRVAPFPRGARSPHVGLEPAAPDARRRASSRGSQDGSYVYFVHSFRPEGVDARRRRGDVRLRRRLPGDRPARQRLGLPVPPREVVGDRPAAPLELPREERRERQRRRPPRPLARDRPHGADASSACCRASGTP